MHIQSTWGGGHFEEELGEGAVTKWWNEVGKEGEYVRGYELLSFEKERESKSKRRERENLVLR